MNSEHRRLSAAYAKHFRDQSTFPLALTIQPNFGATPSARSVKSVRPGFAQAQLRRARELLPRIMAEADACFLNCSKPHFVPPDWRFNGTAVLEDPYGNPHWHLIINSLCSVEQHERFRFLVEVFDNAKLHRNEDCERERKLWETKQRHRRLVTLVGGYRNAPGQPLPPSLLVKHAPAGTAHVALLASDHDVDRWCGYLAKHAVGTFHSLAHETSRMSHDFEPLPYCELSEFFSDVGRAQPARPYAINRNDPTKGTMSFPLRWRHSDKGLLPAYQG